jgi:hypothetical protein
MMNSTRYKIPPFPLHQDEPHSKASETQASLKVTAYRPFIHGFGGGGGLEITVQSRDKVVDTEVGKENGRKSNDR